MLRIRAIGLAFVLSIIAGSGGAQQSDRDRALSKRGENLQSEMAILRANGLGHTADLMEKLQKFFDRNPQQP